MEYTEKPGAPRLAVFETWVPAAQLRSKTFVPGFPAVPRACLIECPVARLKPFILVSVAPSGLIPDTSLPTAGAVGCFLPPLRGWLRASQVF